MTGGFLDTTIIVHISDPADSHKIKSEACVLANQPCETPYYALRELLVGHIQILCDAHNAILAAQNPFEAMLNISHRYAYAGRKRIAILQAIMGILDAAFQQNLTGPRDRIKDEALEALALRINRLWRKANNPKNVSKVQPLSCFNEGSIKLGPDGGIRAPNNSFNCHQNQRCSAAEYIYDNKDDLKKMIAALHPNNLGEKAANKIENQSRRKALKELESGGAKGFDKGKCRALGDAYFVAMSPPGKTLVTSNMEDFLPLCNALTKKVIEP